MFKDSSNLFKVNKKVRGKTSSNRHIKYLSILIKRILCFSVYCDLVFTLYTVGRRSLTPLFHEDSPSIMLDPFLKLSPTPTYAPLHSFSPFFSFALVFFHKYLIAPHLLGYFKDIMDFYLNLLSPRYKNYLKMLIITIKKIVFGSDLNFIFDCMFDASGGNPVLKKTSLAKLIETKETLYLCDIWRIRNPNVRRFTFRQNHVSSFIKRRLHFFLISNILQESIIKTDVLASFCTDHSPIFFSLQLKDMTTREKGF